MGTRQGVGFDQRTPQRSHGPPFVRWTAPRNVKVVPHAFDNLHERSDSWFRKEERRWVSFRVVGRNLFLPVDRTFEAWSRGGGDHPNDALAIDARVAHHRWTGFRCHAKAYSRTYGSIFASTAPFRERSLVDAKSRTLVETLSCTQTDPTTNWDVPVLPIRARSAREARNLRQDPGDEADDMACLDVEVDQDWTRRSFRSGNGTHRFDLSCRNECFTLKYKLSSEDWSRFASHETMGWIKEIS